MPKRITYLEKRDGMAREAFRAHWSTTHADIARELPGVTDYRQNHVLQSVPEPPAEGAYRVDGIVELWFADEDVVHAGFDSDVADRLIVDEQQFLSGLTGGPVHAGAPHAPWPYKLWVLARWSDGADPAPDAVERWASRLCNRFDGALGWGVNVLAPGADLLVREALRREARIPEVAVAIGFGDEAAARAALDGISEGMDRVPDVLARLQACLVEELVII